MPNKRKDIEGRRMTTAQVRSMKEWPMLEAGINIALQRTAEETGVDLADIELVDHVYYWTIRVQGQDIMEVDPRDLSEIANN